MTTGKFFKRLYLWNLIAALLIYFFQKMIAADWIFERVADIRKAAIVEKTELYSLLFFLFAGVHFLFKLIRKRMKRALSNIHFFVTLLSFILFVVVYSKLDAFDSLPKSTITRDIAYTNDIETDIMQQIIWGMFICAQIVFVIAIIHGFLRKKNSSAKTETIKD